jgi:hypothetical protein
MRRHRGAGGGAVGGVVTATGNEVLTQAAPKSVADIEALMRG